jgi:hypothetical protein
MPTILYEQGFRFFFYSADGNEPAHVHVEKGGAAGKWWLDPIRQANVAGFGKRDRSRIRKIIREHHGYFLGRWREAFPSVS